MKINVKGKTMKIKVRQGIFETNSSSIHTICIHKKNAPESQKTVKLKLGWIPDSSRLSSFHDKVNYVYSLCAYMDTEHPVLYIQKRKGYIYRFFKFLEDNGVAYTYDDEEYPYTDDFDEELAEKFFEEDNDLLYQFIFDENSFAITRDNNYRDDPLPEELVEGFKDNYYKYEYDS